MLWISFASICWLEVYRTIAFKIKSFLVWIKIVNRRLSGTAIIFIGGMGSQPGRSVSFVAVVNEHLLANRSYAVIARFCFCIEVSSTNGCRDTTYCCGMPWISRIDRSFFIWLLESSLIQIFNHLAASDHTTCLKFFNWSLTWKLESLGKSLVQSVGTFAAKYALVRLFFSWLLPEVAFVFDELKCGCWNGLYFLNWLFLCFMIVFRWWFCG